MGGGHGWMPVKHPQIACLGMGVRVLQHPIQDRFSLQATGRGPLP